MIYATVKDLNAYEEKTTVAMNIMRIHKIFSIIRYVRYSDENEKFESLENLEVMIFEDSEYGLFKKL